MVKYPTLRKNRAYMLRNDGELFDSGVMHPYILNPDKGQIGNYIRALFTADINDSAFIWFYAHTKS